MGVYIKGMEIPINCMGCPFAFPGVDCAYCNAPNFEESMIIEFKDATKRQEFCPLVEVPTPHGRLIDADEAYDEIAEQKGGNYVDMDLVWLGLYEASTVIEAGKW